MFVSAWWLRQLLDCRHCLLARFGQVLNKPLSRGISYSIYGHISRADTVRTHKNVACFGMYRLHRANLMTPPQDCSCRQLKSMASVHKTLPEGCREWMSLHPSLHTVAWYRWPEWSCKAWSSSDASGAFAEVLPPPPHPSLLVHIGTEKREDGLDFP